MDDWKIVFGENLRRARKAAGYTQKELGDALGCSEKAVSKWERGGSLPNLELVRCLSDFLQVSADALLSGREEAKYFLGIDGGATKTAFRLENAEGDCLATLSLGSCNPSDLGFEASCQVLEEGIKTVCKGIPFREIALFAGISGGGVGENPKRFAAFLEGFGFAAFDNGSDARNIVAAGLGSADGAAVIMGTGSVVYLQKARRSIRLGGLGYLFDGGGNAFSIGRDLIRAVCLVEDGMGRTTVLQKKLEETIGKKAVDYLPEFYAMGKRGIASFAPLVTAAAKEGDEVALEILSLNMKEIASLLEKAKTELPNEHPLKCIFVGGLTAEADLLFPLIRSHLPEEKVYDIRVYSREAVEGAILLAKEVAKEKGREKA